MIEFVARVRGYLGEDRMARAGLDIANQFALAGRDLHDAALPITSAGPFWPWGPLGISMHIRQINVGKPRVNLLVVLRADTQGSVRIPDTGMIPVAPHALRGAPEFLPGERDAVVPD